MTLSKKIPYQINQPTMTNLIKPHIRAQIERIRIATLNPMAVWDDKKIKAVFIRTFRAIGVDENKKFIFVKSYKEYFSALDSAWD